MLTDCNEHMGVGMSIPKQEISTASVAIPTPVMGFHQMSLPHIATLKGAVQTCDIMLTIRVVDGDGIIRNLQHVKITHLHQVDHEPSRIVFDLYHSAIVTGDPAKEAVFSHAWTQFASILSEDYPYMKNTENSAENVLNRGKVDAALAWANEGMNNFVLLAFLRTLIVGFKHINEHMTSTLLRFAQLLNKIIFEEKEDKTYLFEEYFRNNKQGNTIIVPIFSPGHAAYTVVQPSTSRSGMYRIAVCNGGSSCQKFAMRRFTDDCPHDCNVRGHCVILADAEYTARFITLAGSNWETDDVFDKMAQFISECVELESNRCYLSGTNFFMAGNFIQLDELDLLKGTTSEFSHPIFLVEQYQGNCAVLNLIQAMVMCDVDQHMLRNASWLCFNGVVYYTSAILCAALIKDKDELSGYFGHTAFSQVVNSLVYQCLVYQDKLTEGCYIQYVIHKIVPLPGIQIQRAAASNGQDLVFSYCLGPVGQIVVGEPPAHGWETVQLRKITIYSSFGLRLKYHLYPW